MKLISVCLFKGFNVGFPINMLLLTALVSRLSTNALPIPTLRNVTISLNGHYAYPPENQSRNNTLRDCARIYHKIKSSGNMFSQVAY
ncbi:hypothetical protein BTN99_17350 [Vibrio campbellii]|nr:hypothetical protein BTN99_17350 [Vibrio campbellii]